MSTMGTKVKRTVTTETKIKRALTRLQKLVHQYYDENPEMADNCNGDKDKINYYGSAVVGITYDKYIHKWQTVANIVLQGKGVKGDYFEIRSPIDHKPVKTKYGNPNETPV